VIHDRSPVECKSNKESDETTYEKGAGGRHESLPGVAEDSTATEVVGVVIMMGAVRGALSHPPKTGEYAAVSCVEKLDVSVLIRAALVQGA
jgi:hypothetical protein